MAHPLPLPNGAPNQALLDVLAQNGLTIKEFDAILRGAMGEAEMLIPKLIEKYMTSGKIKAAQLALVQRELHALQSALWGDLGASLRQGASLAAQRAADAATDVLTQELAKGGVNLAGWRESLKAQAAQGFDAILAKSANGIPLARSVYKAQALATGLVDRKVAQGLLLGHSAKDIAKSVKGMINPNVKGGVSYSAHRLARTEINNAYKTAQEQRYASEPWVHGMRWNLSKTHPKPDECNHFAQQDIDGLGHGVYKIGNRPRSHPNCLCYLTAEQDSPDDFVEKFLRGDYNSYIDEQVYTHAPGSVKPCP